MLMRPMVLMKAFVLPCTGMLSSEEAALRFLLVCRVIGRESAVFTDAGASRDVRPTRAAPAMVFGDFRVGRTPKAANESTKWS